MNTVVTVILIILVAALFVYVCERIGEQAREATRQEVGSMSGKETGQ